MQLTKTEKLVLQHLAWGRSNGEIIQRVNAHRLEQLEEAREIQREKGIFTPLEMKEMSLETLHTVCCNIRAKTGIKNTKDKDECRLWERKNRASLPVREKGPSPQQRRILHLLAEGKSYGEICKFMRLSRQAAMNLASQARQRVKLQDASRAATQDYLLKMAQLEFGTPVDPMDDPCF